MPDITTLHICRYILVLFGSNKITSFISFFLLAHLIHLFVLIPIELIQTIVCDVDKPRQALSQSAL